MELAISASEIVWSSCDDWDRELSISEEEEAD